MGLSAADFQTHDSESSGQEQVLFLMLVTREEAQEPCSARRKFGETESVAGEGEKGENLRDGGMTRS